MDHKHERFLDEIKKHISFFIQRESNKKSMITLTNVNLSKDFKKVTFFVTVFPEAEEVAALDFLKRNRQEARDYLKNNSKLSRIPFMDFEVDKGEKSRQRLDELSREDS